MAKYYMGQNGFVILAYTLSSDLLNFCPEAGDFCNIILMSHILYDISKGGIINYSRWPKNSSEILFSSQKFDRVLIEFTILDHSTQI